MGFLEDLARKMQEAAEETRAKQRQNQRSGPVWAQPSESKQANVTRRERHQTPPETAPEPQAARAPRPSHRRPAAAPQAAPPAVAVANLSRFARFLRQPKTVRDALILSELLQPPLALRHGQGRFRGRQ